MEAGKGRRPNISILRTTDFLIEMKLILPEAGRVAVVLAKSHKWS